MREFCVAKLLKALDVTVVTGKTSKRRIVTHEKPWSHIDTHEKPWLHIDTHEKSWFSLSLSLYVYIDLMIFSLKASKHNERVFRAVISHNYVNIQPILMKFSLLDCFFQIACSYRKLTTLPRHLLYKNTLFQVFKPSE